MAAPAKKREIQRDSLDRSSDDDDENSSNSEDDEQQAQELGMEIQVDFEGRNPLDPDYHGIKTLLQQLFLKAHINLGNLTDLIISQNYVGSVVKQSEDFDALDDDDDDEESDVNDVFGITTVINLSNEQNYPCIQELRDLLRQLAREHATDATNSMITHVLENNSEALGLLINERFVNIPARISVPLLENLFFEIQKANDKKMPFNFSYYILICKLYKTEEKNLEKKATRKKKNNAEEPAIIWSNPEEEIFAEEATISFEFSVENELDSGLAGTWGKSDDEMIPYRRVLLFESKKLLPIITKIKNQLS